jgi:2-polyprenyl-6-methoxyphenol hydroxylase-like FAD-dependent oxidoreductase
LIEKAPRLRTGGYIVDFWGGGYEVAERMGLESELCAAGYVVQDLLLTDRRGRKVGGFSLDAFRRAAGYRLVSIPRGDLATMIYGLIEGDVETVFGDSIAAIQQEDSGVQVSFESGRSRAFDLVIGAAGIHSPVRDMVFGPESDFARDLGYRVAAFETKGYPQQDGSTYVASNTPGRMVARFAMREDRTLFLFVFRAEHIAGNDPKDPAEVKTVLRQVFGNAGWECPQILHVMDDADDVYFDRVSQIVTDSWSRGRVALVGDAAAAVSLLAGEGTGLAMIEAYVLAGELLRAQGNYREAFHKYEHFLRAFVESKQRSARRFAVAFAPRTSIGLWLRNQATRLLRVPGLAERLLREQFNDEIEFPAYDLTG